MVGNCLQLFAMAETSNCKPPPTIANNRKPSSMRITVTNLSKRYGAHAALDGASFATPEDAGCVVFLGPSGSGKSTLLRVLGSLLAPDAGEVTLGDERLAWNEADTLRQRRENGFVFQGFNLFPHLSALENVALPLRVVHSPEATRTRGARRWTRWSGSVSGRMSTSVRRSFPAASSSAWRWRGRFAPQPRLLLLDEPTSALDPMMTQDVLDLIRELAEGGQRIVLSTHEIAFARKVADWVVFLDHGKVIESSAAEEFFAQPRTALAQQFVEASDAIPLESFAS